MFLLFSLYIESLPGTPMNESVLQYLSRLFESSAPLICSFLKDEEKVTKLRALVAKLSSQVESRGSYFFDVRRRDFINSLNT